MAKKGVLVLIKDDKMKVAYAHRNSELDGLGERIVDMCRELGTAKLKEIYDKITMVDEDTPMTAEQIQAYQKYIPEKFRTDEMDWTYTLKYTLDITEPIKDGFPYMVDYAGFIPSWRARWRYCINLDTGELQIAKAGLEILSQPGDEFLKDVDYLEKIEPCVVGTFPIDAIPDDWMEQCEKVWKKDRMLVALPWDDEAAEANKCEDSPIDQRIFSKMRFYLGRR